MWSFLEKLLSPVYKIIESAAKRKVDEIATTLAVRRAVLRELVRMRFEAYVLTSKLDCDRALGLSQRVIDELQDKFDLLKSNPETGEVRSEIARAVTIKAVKLSTWVEVKELDRRHEFDLRHYIVVNFRDKSGSVHHSSSAIWNVQDEFLFHKPLAILNGSRAKVTQEAISMADDVLKREVVEVLSSDITEAADFQWPPVMNEH